MAAWRWGQERPIALSASSEPPQGTAMPTSTRGFLAVISARGAGGFECCPCGAPTLPPAGLAVLPIGRRMIQVTQAASRHKQLPCCLAVQSGTHGRGREITTEAARFRASGLDRLVLN